MLYYQNVSFKSWKEGHKGKPNFSEASSSLSSCTDEYEQDFLFCVELSHELGNYDYKSSVV
jgi:hypothetical protein